MGNRSKQRRLTDLFIIGTPVRVVGRHDEEIVVWIQKLDPVDHDTAVRKAKAARARARATYQDHTSDEYLEVLDSAQTSTRESLIETIVAPEAEKLKESVTAELELGEDSEWAKDGYLAGLYDELSGGLLARYEEDPDDEEALRVLAELERHDKELTAALEPQLKALRETYEKADIEHIRDKALEAMIERKLQEAWVDEFTRAEVWLACRVACPECETEIAEAVRRVQADEPPQDPKNLHNEPHPKFYFEDRAEVDRLPPWVRNHLEAVYLQLSVDPIEGKDSPETGASSGSSDSSEVAETAASSGPAAVPA